jgi:hypothetical protein
MMKGLLPILHLLVWKCTRLLGALWPDLSRGKVTAASGRRSAKLDPVAGAVEARDEQLAELFAGFPMQAGMGGLSEFLNGNAANRI